MESGTIAKIDQLYHDVLEYRDQENFKDLLHFIKKFRKMAPYNAMLLYMQKPGSVYVASASEWQKKFNRRVKTGARPLIILQPFGPVDYVYEYLDTEGDPLPAEYINPFEAKFDVPAYVMTNLIKSMYLDGIVVENGNYGTDLAGFITANKEHRICDYYTKKMHYTFKSFFQIVLNENLKLPEAFSTVLHELGHLYCGHLNYENRYSWLPYRGDISKNKKEFEAETVCWLLCERMGFVNPSERYLNGYLDENGRIPEVSIDAILKAVGRIENMIQSKTALRKELILSKVKIE